MRGRARSLAVVLLLCCSAAALGWWYYGAFTWNYPRWKSEARLRFWRVFGDPLDREAKSLAGRHAIDCGKSNGREQDTDRVTGCITDAISHHHPFRARFNYFGTESYGAEGLVGSADGHVYELLLRLSPLFSSDDVLLLRRTCNAPLRIAFRESMPIPGCAPFANSAEDYEVLRDDGVRSRVALGY